MKITAPFTPGDIQYLLGKKGLTQKQLAEKYGKSEMTISRVINFKMTSEPLMEAIAKEIEMSPEVVFSEYYNWPKRRSRRNPVNR